MNDTFSKDPLSPEQAEVKAAGALAAAMATGPMFNNDDTTDDPGLASNGEALPSHDAAAPGAAPSLPTSHTGVQPEPEMSKA